MLTRGPMAFAMADITTCRPVDRSVTVFGRAGKELFGNCFRFPA